MSKKIRIEDDGVYVLDSEIKKKLDKVKISPSFVGAWLNSPGDWIMNKFIMPEVQIEETPHLRRGSWFHLVMEKFFDLRPAERTFINLKRCLKNTTNGFYAQEEKEEKKMNFDFSDMAKTKENQDWMKNAIKGFWETWGSQVQDVQIAEVFLQGQSKKGLELFVNGKIGNVSRNCLGFIDRLVEGEMGLIVQDWKTGKKINTYNPSKKISRNNDFGYWRQQLFYTMLLEKMGMVIESACLIFPCSTPPQIVDIDVNLKSAREQVIKDCEQVDLELTQSIENNYFFPFRAGKYNNWATFLCGLGNAWKPKIYEDKLLEIAEIKQ